MILNVSRIKQFQTCHRKERNRHILQLQPPREADSLLFGGAAHKGEAEFFASRDVEKACKAAEEDYRERTTGVAVLPEEFAFIESEIQRSRAVVKAYAEHYLSEEPFQVLQPEVKFRIAVEGSEHHCPFFRKVLQDIFPSSFHNYNSCNSCANLPDLGAQCSQPHFLIGTADGVIQWRKMIWISEFKHSRTTNIEQWFKQWYLSWQPVAYVYGLWKATGIRAHGVMMNLVCVPQRHAKDQFNFQFAREPIEITDAQLEDFEKEFVEIAQEYEDCYTRNQWPKTGDACFNYNRACEYFDLCRRGEQMPGEFLQAEPDYVQEAYYEVLGLPKPLDRETYCLKEVKEQ
jgi:CRISPR/Cas system-associated exonuclease Cas4 (RecB family)